jgi:hypothetical protein
MIENGRGEDEIQSTVPEIYVAYRRNGEETLLTALSTVMITTSHALLYSFKPHIGSSILEY